MIVSIILGLIISNILTIQKYVKIEEENKKLTEEYSIIKQRYTEIEAKNKKLIEDYSILKEHSLKHLDILSSVINSIYLRLGNRLIQKSITKSIPILNTAQTALEIKDDCKTFDELNNLRSNFNIEILDKPAICEIVDTVQLPPLPELPELPLYDDNLFDEAKQKLDDILNQ